MELCKKAFARQRAKDMREQASALLEKDKQIENLKQECEELQAKLSAGKVSALKWFLTKYFSVGNLCSICMFSD